MADDRAPNAPEAEPDRTPRPNRILAEPATIAACADDYASTVPADLRRGAARNLLAAARSH
ncbi:hypothetical protein ACFW1M_11765 [Streptomyces inhibens]|uniref:hypothetical protein n=1 Tax=Streptomyces inhibens TaxID=2293571 RepID=UPI0036D03E07